MNANSGASTPSATTDEPVANRQQPVYKAKRYAVKFNPPAIFLEYEDTAANVRVRAVKLASIQPGTDVDRLTRKVILSFPRKLDAASVKYEQVKNLVIKLVEHAKPVADAPTARRSTGGSFPPRPSPLSVVEGSRHEHPSGAGGTAAGEHGSLTSPISSLSPKVSYARGGLEVTSVRRSSDLGSNHPGGFSGDLSHPGSEDPDDDLDAALDELDRELIGPFQARSAGGAAGVSRRCSSSEAPFSMKTIASMPDMALTQSAPLPPLAPKMHSSLPMPSGGLAGGPDATAAAAIPKTRFAAPAECLELELSISGDMDLNKATEVELKMAKARMDEDFYKNRLKPGDPQFEYDKQVEFGPPQDKNEWDDSDDDDAPPAAASKSSAAKDADGDAAPGENLNWSAIAAVAAQRTLAMSFDEDSGALDVVQVPSPSRKRNSHVAHPVDDVSAEFP